MSASRDSEETKAQPNEPVPGFSYDHFLELRIGQKIKSKAYRFQLKDELIAKAYPGVKFTAVAKRALPDDAIAARLTTEEDKQALQDIVDVVKLNARAIELRKETPEQLEKQLKQPRISDDLKQEIQDKLDSPELMAAVEAELKEKEEDLSSRVTAFKVLVQSFKFPDITDNPMIGSLKGEELAEFKFLYQVEVMNLCLTDNTFKLLLEKKEQLSEADLKLYGKYQDKLIGLTQSAKNASDFALAKIEMVGFPNKPEDQFSKAVQLVGGIDLSKPNEKKRLPAGTVLYQIQADSKGGSERSRIGDYWALTPTEAPLLGVANASTGTVVSGLIGTGPSTKTVRTYVTTKDLEYYDSFAGPIADDWSHQETPIITPGGAHQLYIPLTPDEKRSAFVLTTTGNVLEEKAKNEPDLERKKSLAHKKSKTVSRQLSSFVELGLNRISEIKKERARHAIGSPQHKYATLTGGIIAHAVAANTIVRDKEELIVIQNKLEKMQSKLEQMDKMDDMIATMSELENERSKSVENPELEEKRLASLEEQRQLLEDKMIERTKLELKILELQDAKQERESRSSLSRLSVMSRESESDLMSPTSVSGLGSPSNDDSDASVSTRPSSTAAIHQGMNPTKAAETLGKSAAANTPQAAPDEVKKPLRVDIPERASNITEPTPVPTTPKARPR